MITSMTQLHTRLFGMSRCVAALSSGNERFQARENLAHDGIWGMSDETGLPRAPVEGANLVHENHSRDREIGGEGDLERISLYARGDRAEQGEATCTVVRAR